MTKTQLKIERTKDGSFVVRFARFRLITTGHLRRQSAEVPPNTPSNYAIWQAASQYQEAEGKSGVELTDISLLGYGRNWKVRRRWIMSSPATCPPLRSGRSGHRGSPPPAPQRPRQGLSGGRFAPEVQARQARGLAVSVVRRGRARGRCPRVRRLVERLLLVRGSRRGILGLWALESIWLFWAFGFLGLLRLVPPPLSGSASKQILSGNV